MLYDIYAVDSTNPVLCYCVKASLREAFGFMKAFEREFGKEDTRNRFHFNVRIHKEG